MSEERKIEMEKMTRVVSKLELREKEIEKVREKEGEKERKREEEKEIGLR